MKKILLSVITLIYMVLVCGVAMEIHYCMGKKAGVELYGSNSDECGLCGMTEKKGGCCHDEHQFYKIDDSHKNVSNDLDLASPFTVAALTYPSYNWQLPQENAAAVEKDHSPPLYSRPPATVLHCVFRL